MQVSLFLPSFIQCILHAKCCVFGRKRCIFSLKAMSMILNLSLKNTTLEKTQVFNVLRMWFSTGGQMAAKRYDTNLLFILGFATSIPDIFLIPLDSFFLSKVLTGKTRLLGSGVIQVVSCCFLMVAPIWNDKDSQPVWFSQHIYGTAHRWHEVLLVLSYLLLKQSGWWSIRPVLSITSEIKKTWPVPAIHSTFRKLLQRKVCMILFKLVLQSRIKRACCRLTKILFLLTENEKGACTVP